MDTLPSAYPPAEREATPENPGEWREYIQRRLGALADFALSAARNLGNDAAVAGQLEAAGQDIAEILTALQDGRATVEEAEEQAGSVERRLEAIDLKDADLYERIIDFHNIPRVQPLDTSNAIEVSITGDDTLEVNGRKIEFTGDALYVLNVLLALRSGTSQYADQIAYGFREGPTEAATRSRFRLAIRTVELGLAAITPPTITPVQVRGQGRWTTRRLHQNLQFVERRPDAPEFQHEPDRAAPTLPAAPERPVEPTPPATYEILPGREESELDGPTMMSAANGMRTTSEAIAAFVAQKGHEVTARQVDEAANGHSAVRPEYTAAGKALYSWYGARHIIAALTNGEVVLG